MLIRCCFVIIVMVDTLYFASSQNPLNFSPAFGIVHHVLLQHLDFYSNHAIIFPAQIVGGDTWQFHLSLIFCILYIYVCVCMCVCVFAFFFLLISFYLWLVLVFLFSRVYYGFTPLRLRISQHYMSWQLSCPYAWRHIWQPVTGMSIMPLGLMYIFKLLYVIRCFKVMACLGFQLYWYLYKRPCFSLLLLVFLKFLYQGEFLP